MKLIGGGLVWRRLIVAAGLFAAAAPLAFCLDAPHSGSGQKLFASHCAKCHGGNALGGEFAPGIVDRAAARTDENLLRLIQNGLPERGMPASILTKAESQELISFLRSLKAKPTPKPAQTTASRPIPFSEIISPRRGEWLTYQGRLDGNRHSPLAEINAGNVQRLKLKWLYPIASPRLEATPLAIDGVLYTSAGNEAYALDARDGHLLWSYRRPKTSGIGGLGAVGFNRGLAVLEDRLFMVTDNAHLIALDRRDGKLLWDVEMADAMSNYAATSAPLVVGDLVIPGISGGDDGARGFLAAYKASTGERVWKFWTVPGPGEKFAETWGSSNAYEHGGSSTWLTGTYDAETGLLYWPVGNPGPDFDGDDRPGDNLYSDSMLAIEAKTGKIRWHYQFTPHDLYDWSAQETPMLLDAPFQGRERKLLVQANRNGFFYVFDRLTGGLLLGKPFVEKMNWAKGIGGDGRPIRVPGMEPSEKGVRVCPSMDGATNWMSSAYDPERKLFYVVALERCSVFFKTKEQWKPLKSYFGGRVNNEEGHRFLKALDINTGKSVWEYAQGGPVDGWGFGGLLSTAGGVIFLAEHSGDFTAVDSQSGKALWRFPANQTWVASPMTYTVDGRQYIAISSSSGLLVFGLPD